MDRRRYLPLVGLVGLLTACDRSAPSPPAVAPATPPVAIASAEAPGFPASPSGSAQPAPPGSSGSLPGARQIPIPGTVGPVTVDYVAYDSARGRVWIPVGETGSADVFDVSSATFTRVNGFKTEPREFRGRKRVMGPSAVAVGDGYVYVGDRATNEVCSVDATTLELGPCLKLSSPTDGVAYVASVKEVWVTTPTDQSLTVLDAAKPRALVAKLAIPTQGAPEGLAVDEARGLFYTNLEDKNLTLAIDIKTHTVKATWTSACGPDGPRGVAVDGARNLVFVACTDGVQIFDRGHDGAVLGKLDTGAGVDNIDYVSSTGLLYAAAGKAARLTVARFDARGRPTIVATIDTAEGARNAVGDENGDAYVADARSARILVFAGPSSRP
jgi:DNA-binding beta-propeller fold protein YncE